MAEYGSDEPPVTMSSPSTPSSNIKDFINFQHATSLLDATRDMRRQNEFSDVTLKAGDHTFPCHRLILAAHSCYFRAMFVSQMKETSAEVIEINDIKPEVLEKVVDFMYSGNARISTEETQSLLQACDLLQVTTLKNACAQYMEDYVGPGNCIGLYRFAEFYNLDSLRDKSRETMLRNFADVVTGEEFRELDHERLVEYIQDDELYVPNEDDVFTAVIKWVDHNPEARKDKLVEIMEYVRFPFCSPEFMCDIVEDNSYMNGPSFQEFLKEYRVYHMIPSRRLELSQRRVVPRNSLKKEYLISFGGIDDANKGNMDGWYLNEDRMKWKRLIQLPQDIRMFGMCTLGEDMVITGGYCNGQRTNASWLYSCSTKQWRQLSSMKRARIKHGSIECDGKLYVIGGQDGGVLSSSECYEPKTNTWLPLPELPEAVGTPAVAVFRGKLLVFGGIREDDSSSSAVQCYNPHDNSWSQLTSIPVSTRCGSAALVGSHIYCHGGFKKNFLSYAPDADTWQVLNESQEAHGNGRMISYRNKLLLAGGMAGSRRLSVIEVYDPETNSWEFMRPALKKPLSSLGFVALNLCTKIKSDPAW